VTGPLRIRAVTARLVRVPMRRPLHTSASRVTEAPLVLIDLDTEEGITGRTYIFCYLESAGHAAIALIRSLTPLLAGKPAEPAAVRRILHAHFRLLGVSGLVSSVLAGLDIVCWDALAINAGLPLVRLLGGEPRRIPAYNSNGLGLLDPDTAAEEAGELAAEGFPAVKMRLGRSRPQDDLAAVRAVRRVLNQDLAIMADFNQALSLHEARDLCRRLDEEGLAWMEEPIRHDDYAGAAELSSMLRTPVQIGENFAGPSAMAAALAHRASDLVMPDVDRIGGVTGWLEATALAEVAGVPVSNHLYPEVSAHLLASTPTAHWLEYVDWAAPILVEPLAVSGGAVSPPDRPGSGVQWDEDAVARYRLA
jgi:mandelate racemase